MRKGEREQLQLNDLNTQSAPLKDNSRMKEVQIIQLNHGARLLISWPD